MKKYSLLLLIIIALINFSQFSCNTTGPGPTKDVELNVSDVSCTEAWLKLTVNNLTSNTQVQLVRNSIVVNTFDITTRDTILYDDSLSPNKTYSYQVIELHNGKTAEKSEMITAKTMDTTSNDFTWQTFIFGGNAGSCSLNDVAIVNDTLAYAVGEVYLNDSTGQPDPYPYNFAEWNGSKWELKKINVNFRGTKITPPVDGIFTLSEKDIWLVGSLPIHGDGENWIMYDLRISIDPNLSLSKAWGSNSNNMYFVGVKGNIAHYSKGIWQKIESGTTLNITDVYGSPYSSDIYASLYNTSSSLAGHDLLKITNNNRVYNLTTPNNLYEASSLWVDNKDILFIVGSGLFRKAYGNWEEINEFKMKSLTGIKANGLNDIFVIGSTRSGHFNGKTWTIYNELNFPSGLYYAIDFKNNIVIAGYDGTRAIITVGKR